MADEALYISEQETLTLIESVSEIIDVTERTEILELQIQGPPGPQGIQGLPGPVTAQYVCAQAISGHTAITLDANGKCIPASCAEASHSFVAGITTGAAVQDAQTTALTGGTLEHLGWSFTAGSPVFLGLDGAITQTVLPQAVFAKVLGTAVSPTRIAIDFQPAIFIEG